TLFPYTTLFRSDIGRPRIIPRAPVVPRAYGLPQPPRPARARRRGDPAHHPPLQLPPAEAGGLLQPRLPPRAREADDAARADPAVAPARPPHPRHRVPRPRLRPADARERLGGRLRRARPGRRRPRPRQLALD